MITRTNTTPTYLARCGRVFRAYVRAVNATGSAPQLSDITPDTDIDYCVALGAEIIARAMMELLVSRLTEGSECTNDEIASRFAYICAQLESARRGLSTLASARFYEHHDLASLLAERSNA